jgi:hypothetical protein
MKKLNDIKIAILKQFPVSSGDSGEGDRDSGLIVISIPG